MAGNDSECHMERSDQITPEICASKYYKYLLVLWKTFEIFLENNFEILWIFASSMGNMPSIFYHNIPWWYHEGVENPRLNV